MRRLSEQRRRLAAMAGGLAAMSGTAPLLLQHHSRLRWGWLALMVTLMVWVIVLMVRLRRNEGCG